MDRVMDLAAQLQPFIEQILNYVHQNGPDGMAQLMNILGLLQTGFMSVAAVSGLIAHWPALVEMWAQLIALISSGAGAAEIAASLANFASTMGIAINAVIHFFQLIAPFITPFIFGV